MGSFPYLVDDIGRRISPRWIYDFNTDQVHFSDPDISAFHHFQLLENHHIPGFDDPTLGWMHGNEVEVAWAPDLASRAKAVQRVKEEWEHVKNKPYFRYSASDDRFHIQTLEPGTDPTHTAWVYDEPNQLLYIKPNAHHFELLEDIELGEHSYGRRYPELDPNYVWGDIQQGGKITWSRGIDEAILEYLARNYNAHFASLNEYRWVLNLTNNQVTKAPLTKGGPLHWELMEQIGADPDDCLGGYIRNGIVEDYWGDNLMEIDPEVAQTILQKTSGVYNDQLLDVSDMWHEPHSVPPIYKFAYDEIMDQLSIWEIDKVGNPHHYEVDPEHDYSGEVYTPKGEKDYHLVMWPENEEIRSELIPRVAHLLHITRITVGKISAAVPFKVKVVEANDSHGGGLPFIADLTSRVIYLGNDEDFHYNVMERGGNYDHRTISGRLLEDGGVLLYSSDTTFANEQSIARALRAKSYYEWAPGASATSMWDSEIAGQADWDNLEGDDFFKWAMRIGFYATNKDTPRTQTPIIFRHDTKNLYVAPNAGYAGHYNIYDKMMEMDHDIEGPESHGYFFPSSSTPSRFEWYNSYTVPSPELENGIRSTLRAMYPEAHYAAEVVPNRAEREWQREELDQGIWPNGWSWYTSWIYFPEQHKLAMKASKSMVNHGELLSSLSVTDGDDIFDWPAIYGLILRNNISGSPDFTYAIWPEYSDYLKTHDKATLMLTPEATSAIKQAMAEAGLPISGILEPDGTVKQAFKQGAKVDAMLKFTYPPGGSIRVWPTDDLGVPHHSDEAPGTEDSDSQGIIYLMGSKVAVFVYPDRPYPAVGIEAGPKWLEARQILQDEALASAKMWVYENLGANAGTDFQNRQFDNWPKKWRKQMQGRAHIRQHHYPLFGINPSN